MLKSKYLQEADFSSFAAYLQNSWNIILWPCQVDVTIFTLEWGNRGKGDVILSTSATQLSWS